MRQLDRKIPYFLHLLLFLALMYMELGLGLSKFVG
jgi:hypothetical protein